MQRHAPIPRFAALPILLLSTMLLMVGCGEGASPPEGITFGPDVLPTDLTYAPELGVDFSEMEQTSGGVWIRDVVEGDGEEAVPGRQIRVHYTGYFPDGSSFDSSRGGDAGFSFPLGAGRVIPGWDDGVAGMRVGGERILVIPWDMAYGPPGAGGVIPPYAILVFEVELLEVE